MKRVVERFLNALAGCATLSPIERRLVLPATHADGVRPRVRRAALPSVALLARGNVSMALAYADSEADYQEKKERVLAYDFRSFFRHRGQGGRSHADRMEVRPRRVLCVRKSSYGAR